MEQEDIFKWNYINLSNNQNGMKHNHNAQILSFRDGY